MQTMARAAVAALFLFTAGFPPDACGSGEGDGANLLHRVAEKYSTVTTLSATFRQEVPLQDVGIVRKASGQVYFRRPLRMRWDYRTPGEQLFLADGRYFYFRPPDSPRVFRRRIDEGGLGGKIPLLLLFGKGDITEYFRVEEEKPLPGGKETLLRLVPKGDGAPEVRRVDLVVDDTDLTIRQVHLYDRLGGANHLYLDDIVVNPTLPPDLFRYREAQGVEVVDG
ncbi:MAG: outer membrane lipoprotein carrier protein LolA, outer membrane lipoprotein carrier protein [Deltaproteobacteria bacterium CSP1-8]|jgi:outer membrane lipoprotein carrier protein|nr:MAG: outer membrane lipoprotein carrier protein LolA, outer membrane lipoprotein carrier protein [Deltaproteobacteria bacterium CSP1-8]